MSQDPAPQTNPSRAPRRSSGTYYGEISRTLAGSLILKLSPNRPDTFTNHHRQIAAVIYELAAEMERRSFDAGARWVIAPEVMSGRMVIELVRDESAEAEKMLTDLMGDYQLI